MAHNISRAFAHKCVQQGIFLSQLLQDEDDVLKAFKHKAKQKKISKGFLKVQAAAGGRSLKKENFEVIWKLFKVVFCFLYIELPASLPSLLYSFWLKGLSSVALFSILTARERMNENVWL